MVLIAPSILSADFSNLLNDIKKVENADLIHFDVMDGHYVPNLTFGMPLVKSLKGKISKPFDVHLMISNPDEYIEKFAEAGANYLTFHVETVKNPIETIDLIKGLGVKAGISVNNRVDVEEVLPFVKDVDLVLVMSVEAGFGGQRFNPLAIDKIKKIKGEIEKNNSNTLISVDGGINRETGKQVVDAGADILVAGSFIFKSENPSKTVEDLKKL